MDFDKNIQLPKRGIRQSKYHFEEMPIGSSKWWPGTIFTVSGAATAYARRHKSYIFQCRTELNENVKGVRVWRVKRK